jgi:IS1 family transposase
VNEKSNRLPLWTDYSRKLRRIICYEIGNKGVRSARKIYEKAKAIVGKISHIYSDANSCYKAAFKNISEPHTMTKKETHLIESSNSSIRDNLARFNRRTKRFSKSLEMLDITLDLFINRKMFDIDYKVAIK